MIVGAQDRPAPYPSDPRGHGSRDEHGSGEDDERKPDADTAADDLAVVRLVLERGPADDEPGSEHADDPDPRTPRKSSRPAERKGRQDEDEQAVVRALHPIERNGVRIRPRDEDADERKDGTDSYPEAESVRHPAKDAK